MPSSVNKTIFRVLWKLLMELINQTEDTESGEAFAVTQSKQNLTYNIINIVIQISFYHFNYSVNAPQVIFSLIFPKVNSNNAICMDHVFNRKCFYLISKKNYF